MVRCCLGLGNCLGFGRFSGLRRSGRLLGAQCGREGERSYGCKYQTYRALSHVRISSFNRIEPTCQPIRSLDHPANSGVPG
jgi:hypothetical protein